MTYTLIQHKVENYDKWKSTFEENNADRKARGCEGGCLFRNIDNQNEITIILKWDTIENARKFTGSEELKKRMQKGGVVEKPHISFVEEIECYI